MKETATHLTATIDKAMPLLSVISNEQASIKPAPEKWSNKEIIGHLIDSANNNVQKFIRTMAENGVSFVPYDQEVWVNSQHYNTESWEQILQTWKYLNYHIAHIMEHIPASTLQHEIYIGNSGPFKLEFIVKDYVEHLKHHLQQIFPKEAFLKNSFEMVY